MITAAVVTFHTSREDLTRLIDCVLQSPIDKFFIIDNSTNDALREFQSVSERITYIHSDNLGFGSGHNIAINMAIDSGSDYHIIINPDIYWEGNIVEKLVQFMNGDKGCGLVMPKVLYPNGETQYLCKLLPTPFDLFGRRFIPFKKYREKHDAWFELHWTGYDKTMEIPSLSGCFMFVRTCVLARIGGFDERFFMYAEDLDLCRRIGEVSRTMYYPNVSIYHEYEKGSYKNRKLLKYHICSVIQYFNKWGWVIDRKRAKRNAYCLKLIENLLK
ncbi:glycosyltransferase family 2 protein [Phocaeicola sp.]|uniref:glycosyltransferase n=1 Tax=Phocaeicola sp. TaxID=2773926 RepID=UPI0023D07B65|nr:glycosyltransferase family 2 protein [Phocaeicola sp.]MDE5677370.1 glycosyltransferase family 2 protein [Phocaeicola sp.]